MPSIATRKVTLAVSAATSLGVCTVSATTDLYPGTYGWLYTSNGSSRARVKILKIIDGTTFLVRKMPTAKEKDGTSFQSESNPPARYGVSDVSAFNGSSFISVEAQTAPVDPSLAKRSVP